MRVILERILRLVAVLLGVSFLVFLLLNLLPGDPAEVIVASSGTVTPEAVDAVRQQLGLDRPFIVRYFDWLFGALQGDLGTSYRTGQPVSEAIGQRLPVTIQLIIMTELFALAVAVPAAVYSASRRDGVFDRIVASICFGLQAVPNFMIVLISILLFAVTLGWLPAIGYVPFTVNPWESIRSLIIPTLGLSAALIAVYIRVLRNEMIRTLQEDFILMGRTTGLPRGTLLFRYALKPSLSTLVTVVGVNIVNLVGGTVVVEVISGVAGIGTLLLSAINDRDYLLVQGIVLIVATIYVVANFAVDIFHTALDPRTRIKS